MARRSSGSVGRECLVLDAQGLSKAATHDPVVRVFLTTALRLGVPVVVPTVAVTETTRGSARDAPIHRLLKGVRLVDLSYPIARSAGALLGMTRRSDTIDAVVAATALSLGGPVRLLTSDPDDLGALTGHSPLITVERV